MCATCDGATSHTEMYSDEVCSRIEINLVILTIFMFYVDD